MNKEPTTTPENSPRLWREGNIVNKVDPDRLGLEWKSKMVCLLNHIELGAWAGFLEEGYRTYYIEGIDLQGNSPFEIDRKRIKVVLDTAQLLDVLTIFGDAVRAGRRLGYTFGDITCGNIMTDGKRCFLIDYDVIVPWPLPESHIRVWMNTLQLLFQ